MWVDTQDTSLSLSLYIYIYIAFLKNLVSEFDERYPEEVPGKYFFFFFFHERISFSFGAHQLFYIIRVIQKFCNILVVRETQFGIMVNIHIGL